MAQSSSGSISTTVIGALRRITNGSHALAAVAGLCLVVFAGLIAPGESPGVWVWIRMLLAACSAGLALAVIDTSRTDASAAQHRSGSLLVAGVFLLVTIVLSATFTTLTVIMALLVLGLVLLHQNARGPSSLAVLWALLGILVPFWVWSAFDAWDRLLLLLIPLGVVGIISLEHALRADLYNDVVRERFAAWLGILAMTAMLLIGSLTASIDAQWVVNGAIVTVLLAAADLVPARRSFADALPSITLPAVALLVLMLTWLVAL